MQPFQIVVQLVIQFLSNCFACLLFRHLVYSLVSNVGHKKWNRQPSCSFKHCTFPPEHPILSFQDTISAISQYLRQWKWQWQAPQGQWCAIRKWQLYHQNPRERCRVRKWELLREIGRSGRLRELKVRCYATQRGSEEHKLAPQRWWQIGSGTHIR